MGHHLQWIMHIYTYVNCFDFNTNTFRDHYMWESVFCKFQINQFMGGQTTELTSLTALHHEEQLPLTYMIPPPPASTSSTSNRCQSPSCLALCHHHPCLHQPERIGRLSPDDFCAAMRDHGSLPQRASLIHSSSGREISSGTLPARSCHSYISRGLVSVPSQSSHSITCSNTNLSTKTLSSQDTQTRLSRSLEDLPRDIREHILKCKCSCDHLGYGNCSVSTQVNVI